MKYIIEGGIDFYSELNKTEDNPEDKAEDNNNICLISKELLSENFITLPCNHKFNYIPLYKEIILQKTLVSYLEIKKPLPHQIKCPYCRQIINKLLPYIPINDVDKIPSVNFPLSKCMKHLDCQQQLKNKSMCNRSAYTINGETYCENHWLKKKTKQIEWTDEMDKYSKNKKITDLKKILRENGLKTYGNKKELINRIITSLVNI